MKLNKEAVKAAAIALFEGGIPFGASFGFEDIPDGQQSDLMVKAETAIIAYAEYPDSGLVEREELATLRTDIGHVLKGLADHPHNVFHDKEDPVFDNAIKGLLKWYGK